MKERITCPHCREEFSIKDGTIRQVLDWQDVKKAGKGPSVNPRLKNHKPGIGKTYGTF